ncbi:MAG: response regulator FixJ [Phreatobacter sp.]
MPGESIVHVVDDDLAVRQSLAFLLASDGLPVRLYESAQAFLDQPHGSAAGCIVTDVRMPGIDGIEFLRRLKASGSPLPVIVITGHADVPLAITAMKEGAMDFIEKPFADDLFLDAVRAVLRKQVHSTLRQTQMSQVSGRLRLLSERERQVLDGLLAGKANKVIAYDLNISPRTIEIYRANVMSKMQAGSLSELVRMALLVEGGPRD